ncbi:MAG: xanthine dehydrogenase family protein subunit M [Phycisphaerales bacterium]|nr:MAG: xanthine dehydrogenase family protein subunit M [Phycisphaerales bacterium]
MFIPEVQLHEPASLDEVGEAMTDLADDARLLAGGTDLLVDLKTGRVRAGHLISLHRIGALRGVSEAKGGLRVGALTTITQLDRSRPVGERFPALREATSRMAAPQIRNAATVGGNIACAVPCADLPPILTAMKASVILWSTRGHREVALEAFFAGPRQTVRRNDEVLTAVEIPKPSPGFGAAYARFALRDGNAIAVASVAAGLWVDRGGAVREARIVLGAVAPVPKLVEAAGAELVGQAPDEDVFSRAADIARDAAEPISDVRGSADFRREIVGVLTRRALRAALRRAEEAK